MKSLSNAVMQARILKKILDDLGMNRYCCRRMLLTHKEIIDDLNPYQ